MTPIGAFYPSLPALLGLKTHSTRSLVNSKAIELFESLNGWQFGWASRAWQARCSCSYFSASFVEWSAPLTACPFGKYTENSEELSRRPCWTGPPAAAAGSDQN